MKDQPFLVQKGDQEPWSWHLLIQYLFHAQSMTLRACVCKCACTHTHINVPNAVPWKTLDLINILIIINAIKYMMYIYPQSRHTPLFPSWQHIPTTYKAHTWGNLSEDPSSWHTQTGKTWGGIIYKAGIWSNRVQCSTTEHSTSFPSMKGPGGRELLGIQRKLYERLLSEVSKRERIPYDIVLCERNRAQINISANRLKDTENRLVVKTGE